MLFSLGADDTSRTALESSGLLNRNRPPATTVRRRLLLEIESHQIEDADGGAYSSERAAREWSTVVDISIKPPSFKPVSLSSPRSPLSKTPKQVFF